MVMEAHINDARNIWAIFWFFVAMSATVVFYLVWQMEQTQSASVDSSKYWEVYHGTPTWNNALGAINDGFIPVVRRNINKFLAKYNSKLKDLFITIERKESPFKIGFDSCSVSGILSYMENPNLAFIEPCEAGRFSAFISEKLQVHPFSFMTDYFQGISLKENSLLDIWKNGSIFIKTREKLSSNKCSPCNFHKLCMNGCPFLSEINLCNQSSWI